MLANLLMDSEEDHFAVLFKKLKAHQEAVVPLLEEEMVKSLPEATEVENDVLTQRQARAAVAMVRLGQAEPVWPLLQAQPRSQPAQLPRQLAEAAGGRPEGPPGKNWSASSRAQGSTPMDGQQAMDAVLFHPETSDAPGADPGSGWIRPDELSPDKREPLVEHCWRCTATTPTPGFTGRRNGRYGDGSSRRS